VNSIKTLRVGHTPDPDDAFMFYGFQQEAVTIPGYRVQHVLKDIQELNTLARTGELEVTAVSAAAYPSVADKYYIMNVGSSVGRGYGPIVVGTSPRKLGALLGRRLAVPGLETTAYLLARLYLPEFTPVVVPFDQVMPAVKDGRADFALVIHDGQLTYEESGFHKVVDLGAAWEHETGLPIPLGLDLVRRDLGHAMAEQVCAALKASIEYGLAHPEGADEYARSFGRHLDLPTSARFVRMYVNDDTLDLGADGRAALETLWTRAADLGFTQKLERIDVVGRP
jgi:1,4-dihydroxy-6-naphthoate synthase